MTNTILPGVRKKQILEEAIKIALIQGYHKLSILKLSKKLKISHSTILYHYRNLDILRDSVVIAALERDLISIIAEAYILRHPRLKNISEELKEKIRRWI